MAFKGGNTNETEVFLCNSCYNICMRIIITIIFLMTLVQAVGLNWGHNYKKALNRAKQLNKDIYLFVGADHCRFCDMYKKNALNDTVLLNRLKKHFVLLYLSRDTDEIPSKFETKGVPKHYFLDAKGEEYFHTWGYYDARSFHLIIDEALLYKD